MTCSLAQCPQLVTAEPVNARLAILDAGSESAEARAPEPRAPWGETIAEPRSPMQKLSASCLFLNFHRPPGRYYHFGHVGTFANFKTCLSGVIVIWGH
jgi:hypothetical protein